ncbi:hypothetical protein M8J76_011795 [Diaphorina citri]|nr:hypothetical protein M8J75_001808 [Diaphorina citri]KAI5723849.1 hypothetical protein M8J76_011795 [Diaphorina citri]KAI5727723.1 hypothetical protein M8J77_006089 [Diaphorina citri]
MANCARCRDPVIQEDLLKCFTCSLPYHYLCAGKNDMNFKKMGKAKLTWKCLSCKEMRSSNEEEADLEDEQTKTRDDKLLEQMKKMFQEFSKDINSKLLEFENSLQFHSGKLEDVISGFNEMKKNFSSLQKKQEELANENVMLKNKVKELSFQVHDMDQRSLDHNLEILGIPDVIEDPKVIMGSLCEKIQIQVPDPGTYVVKRVAVGAKNKPKALIAQFNSKQLRDKILKESKKSKPRVSDFTKAPSDIQPVFINEQLTPYMKQLFFNVTKEKKEKGFAYVWIAEGRILLRKTEQSKICRIRCIEDVLKT